MNNANEMVHASPSRSPHARASLTRSSYGRPWKWCMCARPMRALARSVPRLGCGRHRPFQPQPAFFIQPALGPEPEQRSCELDASLVPSGGPGPSRAPRGGCPAPARRAGGRRAGGGGGASATRHETPGRRTRNADARLPRLLRCARGAGARTGGSFRGSDNGARRGPSSTTTSDLLTSSASRSSTSRASMPPLPHTYSAASSDQLPGRPTAGSESAARYPTGADSSSPPLPRAFAAGRRRCGRRR